MVACPPGFDPWQCTHRVFARRLEDPCVIAEGEPEYGNGTVWAGRPGDWEVINQDGYHYVIPAKHFERMYQFDGRTGGDGTDGPDAGHGPRGPVPIPV